MQFKIDVAVFSHILYFWVGKEEWEDFKKCSLIEEGEIDLEEVDGLQSENRVWIKYADDVLVASHEISHAVCSILDIHKLPEDTELRAYLMGYITQEYYNHISAPKPQIEVTEPEESFYA